MRRLLQTESFRVALPAATVVTGLCVPYLLRFALVRPASFVLLHWCLTVVLWQIVLAWDQLPLTGMLPPGRPRYVHGASGLAALLAAALVLHVAVDPLLARAVPGYGPADWPEFWQTLAWVATFQPLLLVATVMAFSRRLSGRLVVGLGAVTVVSQVLVFLRYRQLPADVVLAVTLFGGLRALVLALAYRWAGLIGLSVTAAGLYLRFTLSLPGL